MIHFQKKLNDKEVTQSSSNQSPEGIAFQPIPFFSRVVRVHTLDFHRLQTPHASSVSSIVCYLAFVQLYDNQAATSSLGTGLFRTSTLVCTKLNALWVSPSFSYVRIVASPSRYTNVLEHIQSATWLRIPMCPSTPDTRIRARYPENLPFAQAHNVIPRRPLWRKARDPEPRCLSVVLGTVAGAYDILDNWAFGGI